MVFCLIFHFFLTVDPFNTSPQFSTIIPPFFSLSSVSLCLTRAPSLGLSLSVSDRVCYMSRLPACSVPTSPSSGDVVSCSLSPGNRRVRSPPHGGLVWAGRAKNGRRPAGFFSSYSKVVVIQKNKI